MARKKTEADADEFEASTPTIPVNVALTPLAPQPLPVPEPAPSAPPPLAPELVELGRRHAVPHDLDEVVLRTLKHEADKFVVAFDNWAATVAEINRECDLPTLYHERDQLARSVNSATVGRLFDVTGRIVALTSDHIAVGQAVHSLRMFRRRSFDDLVRPAMLAFGDALQAGLQGHIDRARTIEGEFLQSFGSGRFEGTGPIEAAVRAECADLIRIMDHWREQDAVVGRSHDVLLAPESLVSLARKALEL